MNSYTEISANIELRNDLLQVAGDYLPEATLLEFGNLFSRKEYFTADELSNINPTNRTQIEFKSDQVVSRYYLDRTISFSRKNLSTNEYIDFLLSMTELCISHGLLKYADEIILKIKRENLESLTTANINYIQGDIYARSGKWNKSLEFIKKAKKIYAELDYKEGLAKCYNITGSIHGEQGDLAKASRNYKSCHTIAQELDNSELQSLLEINLGIINTIKSKHSIAKNYFNSALEKLQKSGNDRRICEVKHNIGLLYIQQQKLSDALQELDSAIEIAIKHEFNSILSKSLISKTEILIDLNELATAYSISQKALETAHLINDRLTIAEVYRIQGVIQRKLKNYLLAENNFISALRINKKLDIKLNIAECYYELAIMFNETANTELEKAHLADSLQFYSKINLTSKINEIQQKLDAIVN